MLASLTREDFASRIGEVFALRGEDGELSLRLTEAKPLAARAGAGREPFALLFQGPVAPRLAQGIQPLEHPQLGRLEIFLVPVGADEEGARYEAVFN